MKSKYPLFEAFMRSSKLKVDERVRVVRLPPAWTTPGWHIPADTRRVYKLLITRGRPVRIYEVDEMGAWIRMRIKNRRGRIERHDLTLDDGCWDRVRRSKKPGARESA